MAGISRSVGMVESLKKLFSKYEETLLYLIFGVLTTFVNFIVYLTLTDIFDINYLISNIFAFVAAVIFAFITNKIFVFKSHSWRPGKLVFEVTSFFGARIVSLFADMGILFVMAGLLGINDVIAKVCSNVVVVIMNYVFSKWIIFREDRK